MSNTSLTRTRSIREITDLFTSSKNQQSSRHSENQLTIEIPKPAQGQIAGAYASSQFDRPWVDDHTTPSDPDSSPKNQRPKTR